MAGYWTYIIPFISERKYLSFYPQAINYILAIILYFSLSSETTLLMLSCDRIDSAKFIHDTLSPAKLIYNTIRRDSVFRIRFPFLSHDQVFSFEISLVYRLKYPHNCFLLFMFNSYCCSVDPCVVSGLCNQSFFLLFFMKSLSWCINAIFMQGIPLPPSSFDTYSLSVLFLGCKALCIVIIFLVLRSICRSFSIFHFKNGSECLTKGTSWCSFF